MVIIELQCSLGIPQHFLDINVLFVENPVRLTQYYLVFHALCGIPETFTSSLLGCMCLSKYRRLHFSYCTASLFILSHMRVHMYTHTHSRLTPTKHNTENIGEMVCFRLYPLSEGSVTMVSTLYP